ncbi:D-alanyl-D-alanine carboxypeptidase family protein [Sinorhizobium meliloti]|uniref:D-alanyl-D-alanine carboxypeptidase family protein n=1 Tax=Rhizobium meliloti TaxID=382 RepID=UPI000FD70F70|nr:D-alanyl-D-alanine carboxypeptidase family protein [Sinorhizobium meliloti]RVG08625.1 hypothetical protein CN231_26870 [Sinorhizobium meliloti]
MATELESLVLSISADTAQLKRALLRTEKDAKQTADNVGKSFGNVVPFQKMEQSFSRSAGAMKADAQNLRFQLNDLFTQIQSGTSVAQAFGQQAGQISQVLGSAGGVRGAAQLAGTALAGMLNPLYLVPLAVSVALPAIMNYFAEAQKGGELSAKEAGKQVSDIKALAEAWKNDATPALQAYLGELLKVAEETEKAARKNETLDKVFGDAKSEVESLGGEIQNIQSLLQTADFDKFGQLATDLGRAYDEVRAKTEANQPALEEIKRLQDLIAQAQQSQIPAVIALAASIRKTLIPALQEAARVGGDVKAASDFSNPITGPSRGPGGPIDMRGANYSIGAQNRAAQEEAARKQGEADAKAYMSGMQPEFRSRLSAFLAAAQSEAGKIAVTSGYRTAERQAQLFAEAVKKYGSEEAARKWVAPPGKSMHGKGQAADLGFESEAVKRWAHENAAAYGLVFRLKNEDWHIEMERAAATERTAQAQRDQTGASSGLTQGMVQLTDAQKAQLQAQDESRRNAEALAAQWSGTLQNALGGFIADLRQGVEAGDAFKNMLNRVVDSLINTALEAMFAEDALGGVIKQFLGFGGGSGIIPGLPFPAAPTMHRGGKVGGASRSMRSGVNPAAFAGAPRLHNGLLPGEFPAILQKGEIVIPKNLARQPASNSGNVYFGDVTVNADGGVVANSKQGKALGEFLNKAMAQFVVNERRPGGLLRA